MLVSIFLIAITCFLEVAPVEKDFSVSQINPQLLQGAESVVRYSHKKVTIKSPSEYTWEVREAITLMGSSTGYNELEIWYNLYSKAKFREGAIYDRHGKQIRKFNKKDVNDISAYDGFSVYSDSRYLEVEMGHPTYPYTVEYIYEVSYNATRDYPEWWAQRYNQSVEEATFTIESAPGCELFTRELNGPIEFTSSNTDNVLSRQWSVKDLQAIPYETHCPSHYKILPCLLVSPSEFEVEGYSGSMKTWKDFGSFIYRLNEGRENIPWDFKTEVKSLVSGQVTQRDKIQALYRYLQQNTRYVSVQLGVGGWQTFPADYVVENKYGDCKALSYFMKGLLTEVSIESYPVLISSGQDIYFADDFAAPKFNHVILYVPSEDMWLECTSDDYPVGYIGEENSDRNVLLITPTGGEVARTPASTDEEQGTFSNDSLFLDGDTWFAAGNAQHFGTDHELYRAIQNQLSESEKNDYFARSFPLSITSLDRFEVNADQDRPFATSEYQAELNRFGSESGSRYFLPINILDSFAGDCPDEDRNLPYLIKTPVIQHNRLAIQIPEGYIVENLPSAVDVADENIGSYSLACSEINGTVVVERSIEISKCQIPSDRFVELCEFFKKMQRGDRARIVLRKNP